ncbi:MAG: hypothetical protein ABH864_05060 [archaeon]
MDSQRKLDQGHCSVEPNEGAVASNSSGDVAGGFIGSSLTYLVLSGGVSPFVASAGSLIAGGLLGGLIGNRGRRVYGAVRTGTVALAANVLLSLGSHIGYHEAQVNTVLLTDALDRGKRAVVAIQNDGDEHYLLETRPSGGFFSAFGGEHDEELRRLVYHQEDREP